MPLVNTKQNSALLTALMAVLLAASTLSTKAAGAFWLGLLVWGLASNWHHRSTPQAHDRRLSRAIRLAAWWLGLCLLGLLLKTIPMVYWDGPWKERHAEFRLLLGALGAWLCLRYARPTQNLHQWTGHALSLACVLSLALVLGWTSDAAPSYRIPWAAGVSLLTCTTLAWACIANANANANANSTASRIWKAASFLGLLAVMFSGVRGSYPVLIVWSAMWIAQHFYRRPETRLFSRNSWAAIGIAMALIGGVATWMPESFSPFERTRQAVAESGATGNTPVDANSSNGARLTMWKGGLASVAEHTLWGIGYQGAKQLLKKIAEQSESTTIAALGHFHSDYLHPAVEFGSFGLASYLCYGLGLLILTLRLFRHGEFPIGVGLGGILLMHVSTGVTNVNFAHNYYPTILSLCVTLLLLASKLPELSKERPSTKEPAQPLS